MLAYAEAMRRFGTDAPDLRNPLELVDVADLVRDAAFKVFSGPANAADGRVVALKGPGAASKLSRRELDDYAGFVGTYGAKGLAYIRVRERAAGMDGLQSPILKFLDAETVEAILSRVDAKDGDIVFFGADTAKVVHDAMGAFRDELGARAGLDEVRLGAAVGHRVPDVRAGARNAGLGAPPLHPARQLGAVAASSPAPPWRAPTTSC